MRKVIITIALMLSLIGSGQKMFAYPLQIQWWYTGNEEIFYCYYNHINWGWHQGNHYYNFYNNQFIIEVYR